MTEKYWDRIITANRSWRDINLKEVWEYRSLIGLLVRRNFAASYKQTVLGPLWHFINPVISTVVYIVVFDRIAGLPTDNTPPFLFYLSGNVMWSYFAGSFKGTSSIFSANKGLFEKVYFPRLVMPLSIMITNFINVSIRLGIFLVFLIYYLAIGTAITVSWKVIFFPFIALMASGIGLGMGLIVSSLTTKYRDLQVFIGYGMQLLLYSSPVIYPASLVPEKFQSIYQLNPVVFVIEAFRLIFLGEGTISHLGFLYSLGIMIVLLFFGLLLYNKTEANFLDTV